MTLDAPERPDRDVGIVGLLLHGATVDAAGPRWSIGRTDSPPALCRGAFAESRFRQRTVSAPNRGGGLTRHSSSRRAWSAARAGARDAVSRRPRLPPGSPAYFSMLAGAQGRGASRPVAFKSCTRSSTRAATPAPEEHARVKFVAAARILHCEAAAAKEVGVTVFEFVAVSSCAWAAIGSGIARLQES